MRETRVKKTVRLFCASLFMTTWAVGARHVAVVPA